MVVKTIFMSMKDQATDWLQAAIIVIFGIYILATLVQGFCQENGLFCSIALGGGLLAAIAYAAKKIFK